MVPPPRAPMQSPDELLSQQFYAWEKRGRGWQLWGYPVEVEPFFYPFYFYAPDSRGVIDDGHQPTLVSRLAGWARRALGVAPLSIPGPADAQAAISSADEEPEPDFCMPESVVHEYQITLPASFRSNREFCELFLLNLAPTSLPVSFEIIGTSEQIILQIVCRDEDDRTVRQSLAECFPEVVVREAPGFLLQQWWPGDHSGTDYYRDSLVVDFGLEDEFLLPLRISRNFDPDPLLGIFGALADLVDDEVGVFQVLFRPTANPWAESVFRTVLEPEGKSFFETVPHLVHASRNKVAAPLYAAVIRVAARADDAKRRWQIVRGLAGALEPFNAQPPGNRLVPLSNDHYKDEDHVLALLARLTYRGGMLLNGDELLSFVHLPSLSVRSQRFKRATRNSRAAPALALGHALVLGENEHEGNSRTVTLSPEQRTRHMHVVGASGTGKTTFLLNLIRQDIENGDGFAVLDPHGDLIDRILEFIPEARQRDVVLFDPSDGEYPVGLNILEAKTELEKNLLASDLVAVFRRLSTSWGDQMNSILGNAIIAFLESSEGGTLADMRRFLVEPGFRNQFLKTVQDPEIVYYWQKEFPMLTGRPQAPLLTRLDIFLRPKLVRHMVCQRQTPLDFSHVMNRSGIFLGKLAQGAIGEENAALLGAFLVAKFHQTALSRQETGEDKRRNFYLYIDEFQHFITPSMASLLSGVRKFRMGLVLAHQELGQLSRDTELVGSILTNPYARVCFRLGDADAKRLASGLSGFETDDLMNLGTGEAIARLERAEYAFNLTTFPLPELDTATATERKEEVRAASREQYAAQRADVEALLARQSEHWRETREEEAETKEAVAPKKKQPERPAEPAIPEPPASVAPPATDVVTPPITQPEIRPLATPAPEPEFESVPVEETPEPESETPGAEVPVARAPRKPKAAPPVEPATPGRGGKQHKHIQHLIKQWAEGMGWRAEIEKTILAGAGCVDVALEKGSVTIACEISVTTGVDQECANIDKCLKAGFGYVVALSDEEPRVEKIKTAYAKRAKGGVPEQVRFLTVDALKAFVEELEAQAASHETRIKGYKVKTKYKPVDDAQKETKKKVLGQVMLDSLRKKRK